SETPHVPQSSGTCTSPIRSPGNRLGWSPCFGTSRRRSRRAERSRRQGSSNSERRRRRLPNPERNAASRVAELEHIANRLGEGARNCRCSRAARDSRRPRLLAVQALGATQRRPETEGTSVKRGGPLRRKKRLEPYGKR